MVAARFLADCPCGDGSGRGGRGVLRLAHLALHRSLRCVLRHAAIPALELATGDGARSIVSPDRGERADGAHGERSAAVRRVRAPGTGRRGRGDNEYLRRPAVPAVTGSRGPLLLRGGARSPSWA